MQHLRQTDIFRPCPRKQHGAALMVMLIIMIIGAAAILVSSLSSSALRIDQNRKSSEILAQAKEVLIGYAVNGTGGGQRPGDMPYPDRLIEATPNYDGTTDSCPALQASPTATGCLGRLAWKNLQMSISAPSENDPTGYMPWYAVSANMVDPAGVVFNSELLNAAPHTWLTVRDKNGNILSNRVAFLIIVPGAALAGQSRPASPNLGGPNQYLDSITVPTGCTAPCVPGTYKNYDLDDDYIIGEDTSSNFNDKLIYVTIDELMPLIEKRIAREVKGCLDNYAYYNSNQYPWAALVSDTSNYDGSATIVFGRLPTTSPTPSAVVQQLLNLLAALQTALDNYNQGNNYKTQSYITALTTAGTNLANYASTQTPASAAPLDQASLQQAQNAGTSVTAPDPQTSWTNKKASDYVKTVQKQIDQANTFFDSKNHGNLGNTKFIIGWPNCTLLSPSNSYNTYWPDWRNLVFYQIASGYAPGGGGSCTTNIVSNDSDNTACILINGTGNTVGSNGTYHAAVVLAGKKLPDNATRTSSSITNYLDGAQANRASTIASPTPSSRIFNTYKTFDANYPTVNDLALCLDGSVNCK